MVWSDRHQEAVEKIEAVMEDGSPSIDPPDDFIQDCDKITDNCWDSLEEYANERYKYPDYKAGIGNEARRLVKATMTSNGYQTDSLDELFKLYEDEMDKTQEQICKQLIGMTILKNGNEDKGWVKSLKQFVGL